MSQLLQSALHLHQQGRLNEAVELYQQVLKEQPRNFVALNLLGQACQKLGRLQEGVRHTKKSLKLKPDFAQAHGNLGDMMSVLGDFKAAVSSFRRATAIAPDFAGAHAGLAHALLRLAQYDDALPCCQKALQIDPDSIETQNLLGVILMSLGRNSEVEVVHRRVLAVVPDHVPSLSNLGNALSMLGRHQEAEVVFDQALALAPNFVDAHFNRGLTLESLNRLSEAESSFRKVLALDPVYVPAWCMLATLYCAKGLLKDAEDSSRKAIEINPGSANAHTSLGEALKLQGRFEESVASLLTAVRCDPVDFVAHSQLLFAYNFLDSLPATRLERARQCGRLLTRVATGKVSSWKVVPEPERLRVGLVSGDLRSHPVGFFLENVLSQIDPARIELIAYPTLSFSDEVSERMRPHFSAWRPICGKTNQEAAEMIRDDGIHLLVDLSGHTTYNRLPLFAWKPAPVQASWLGYFSTTGVAEIDYLIADEVGVPEGNRAHFTEALWYLPDTRLCYSAPALDIPVDPLPALSNGYVTFGSFQNVSKLGDAALAAWAKVLAAVPGARLRLQSKHFAGAALSDSLRARCARLGIDPARLDINGLAPRNEYLAAHNKVDLILDTFPYPGGTTTCDALWMGVPTLTLRGDTLLSRQGASLLAAGGLPDWIADDEADYVSKAIALAGDLPRLAALRAGLRRQVLASPLFDAPLFARHLEAAFWGMWQAKGAPRPGTAQPSQ